MERDGMEQYHTMERYPTHLEKKMKLLAYFRSYMQENLVKTGASIPPREGDDLIRLPFLRQWFRTSRAVVMHLTNGTLQVTFFRIHLKEKFISTIIRYCNGLIIFTFLFESRQKIPAQKWLIMIVLTYEKPKFVNFELKNKREI